MGTLVLKNATVIDGTGKDPIPNSSLVVEGERIKDILTGPLAKPPSDATIIDCRHQTLLPGLIDAHCHVACFDAHLVDLQRKYFPSYIIIRSVKLLEETLNQGFTTIRDGGGADPGHREAVNQGLIRGPRLFVAGCTLSQTRGHGDFRLPSERRPPYEDVAGATMRICDGVAEVRRAAREQLGQGVDQVKIMASGGAASPCDEATSSQFSLEELKAIVFEAQAVGKYVMAHVYPSKGIRLCVEAGVRSIEHGNLLDEEAANAIKNAGAYLVPTLAVYELFSRMAKEWGIPDFEVKKINFLREGSLGAVSIAKKVGVKIASGSDSAGLAHSYKGMELELKAQVLGPMGAIVAATKTNAELICREKDLGTVEVGKFADLILVNGDPLRDIKVFQKYQDKITLIIKGGEIYKNIL